MARRPRGSARSVELLLAVPVPPPAPGRSRAARCRRRRRKPDDLAAGRLRLRRRGRRGSGTLRRTASRRGACAERRGGCGRPVGRRRDAARRRATEPHPARARREPDGPVFGRGAERPGGHTRTATGAAPVLRRVELDPTRLSRDAAEIAEAVVAHLNGLVGANVQVTLEIHADIPTARRTASCERHENAATLRFDPSTGFERE